MKNDERTEKVTKVLSKRQPDITVVVENIHDPHNISAIMRSCDAIGIQDIYVLNTRVNDYKKFSKKSSAGANKWLTIHEFDDTERCFGALRQRFAKIYATHLGTEARSVYELDLVEPVAFVFGNEITGVSAESLQLCDGNFIIPQVGMVQSLNVSVACAVSLYEAYRQRELAGYYKGEPRLPESQREYLLKRWGHK